MYIVRRVDTFRSGTVRLRELSANLGVHGSNPMQAVFDSFYQKNLHIDAKSVAMLPRTRDLPYTGAVLTKAHTTAVGWY